jgi:hypothetical protein
MNNNNSQNTQGMKPVDPGFLMNEYQHEVSNLTKELMMWRAYAMQLEAQLKSINEAQTQEKEAKKQG